MANFGHRILNYSKFREIIIQEQLLRIYTYKVIFSKYKYKGLAFLDKDGIVLNGDLICIKIRNNDDLLKK